MRVAVLTAGKDPHYALGLLQALVDKGVAVDFVANDEMAASPVVRHKLVHYLNLRGDQSSGASFSKKALRLPRYYLKLIRYAIRTQAPLFHILWFNKFEWFDNTLLIALYRLLGKKLVYTAHNVDTKARDGRSGPLNRWSLRYLYRHVDHVFVHAEGMARELHEQFGVDRARVTALPFPVNDVTPRSLLSKPEARNRLGLEPANKVVLFFGNLAPYKGVEYALEAVRILADSDPDIRLLIVGRVKGDPAYLAKLEGLLTDEVLSKRVVMRQQYVPEDEVGDYFRASDVLVLPYRKIYQSGVIFLSYNQGLPAIAADVGALRESVVEGETGYVCRPEDGHDLAEKLKTYFASSLYRELENRREAIIEHVNRVHSWDQVAAKVVEVYRTLDG